MQSTARFNGISDRIRVLSIIDRYLEDARIFYFQNHGKPEYLLASADWMQRNFDHRVEIAFPVLDRQHQSRLKEILEMQLADSVKGWRIQSDGSSVRTRTDSADSTVPQERLYEIMGTERNWLGAAHNSRCSLMLCRSSSNC